MKPFIRSVIFIIISFGFVLFFSNASFAQTVGADGSFNYTIPIELPDGTAGMAPELALVYNSNAGSGMPGVGFLLDRSN